MTSNYIPVADFSLLVAEKIKHARKRGFDEKEILLKSQAVASVLSPIMSFGGCLSTIFGEKTFCIKKISVSCLRTWGRRFTIITIPSETSGSQSHNLRPTLCQDGEMLIEPSHAPYGRD